MNHIVVIIILLCVPFFEAKMMLFKSFIQGGKITQKTIQYVFRVYIYDINKQIRKIENFISRIFF